MVERTTASSDALYGWAEKTAYTTPYLLGGSGQRMLSTQLFSYASVSVDWAAMRSDTDRATLFNRLSGWLQMPVSEMEAELSRLRQENAKLKLEKEILKKAAAYFAKESI